MASHDHHYQHFALREDGTLVEIHDTAKGDGHVYKCPYCNQPLDGKRGQIKVWHFAHHKDSEVPCSYDHYLHSLAEQKFVEWYNSSAEVWIKLCNKNRCSQFATCHFACEDCVTDDSHTDPINLKEHYETAELEKVFRAQDENNYIADIKLCSQKHPNDPIFLEIYVTHRCTPEKRDSGIRIIEIPIKTEDDIIKWTDGSCWEEEKKPMYFDYKREEKDWMDTHLRFYGFKPNDSTCPDKVISLQKFILFDSNRRFVDPDVTCRNYTKRRRGVFEVTSLERHHIYAIPLYNFCLARAYQLGRITRACKLCKYMHSSIYDVEFCALSRKCGTKEICKDNDEKNCSYFRINQQLLTENLSAYQEFSEKCHFEEWVRPSQVADPEPTLF